MIVVRPASILSEKCQEVDTSEQSFQYEIALMKKELLESGGVGLAAPQIGIKKRIILVHANGSDPVAMINPKIQKTSKKTETAIEECLSIPGKKFLVSRFKSVWFSYTTPGGVRKIDLASGFKARILQHEIDHLNGVTIAERGREVQYEDKQ